MKSKPREIDPLILQLFPSSVSKGDLKKAQIIQSIIDIVASEGFEALSFERIGKEVGIAKSHVVYHFHAKNEMLLMAYQYILNYAQTYIIEGIYEADPGFDRFEAYVRAHFEWMKIKPNHFPFIVMLYGRSAYDEEIRTFNQKVRIAGKTRIRGLIKEDPKIPSALHESAAMALHEMVTGALLDLICCHGQLPPEPERLLKLKTLLSETKRYWLSLTSTKRL